LCQELIYGVVRWQVTLDWLIARKTAGRTQKTVLQDLLRLGLYQIFFLDRIPDHAAVHETVELAKRRGFGAQAGFINAVLRGYLREHDEARKILADLKISQPALGWSHPEWLVARWQKRWGDERTRQLLEWNNTPPKTFARVNALKFGGTGVSPVGSTTVTTATPMKHTGGTPVPLLRNAGDLLTQWRDENVEYDFVRRDWFEENLVFELKSHPPLAGLPSFTQGLFYVQDPGTLLAVRELDPQPGDTILDFCAAPGGKTTYIAQLMNNQGRIVAQDVSKERLKWVEENCARLGVTCVTPALVGNAINGLARPHPDPLPQEREQQQSASTTSKSPRFASRPTTIPPLPGGEGRGEGERVSHIVPSHFDRVLLDAPCSNTGVMRRRVDLRWRIHPEEIQRLRKMQLDLLRQAASAVKPGGVLIYSTCSLEPEENSEVVKEFLAAHSAFTLECERELLPFADGVDGAFAAKLIR
jgi:16S rRNA (cytosine967-C5)-methyltransferase